MLVRKASLIFFYRIFSMLANLAVTYFVARALGPTGYGLLAFSLSVAGIFIFLVDLGLSVAHLKLVAEKVDTGEYLSAILLLKTIFLGLWLIPALIASFIWIINSPPADATPLVVLALFPVTILQIYTTTILNTLDARQEIARSQLVQLVQLICYAGISIALTFFTSAVVFYLLGQALQYVVGLLMLRRMLAHTQLKFPSRAVVDRYLHFIRPLILANVLSLFHEYSDRLFIQIFWNSSEVGYYAAADRLSGLVLLLPGSLMVLLVSGISARHSSGDLEGAKDLCLQSTRTISLLVTPVCLVMFWFAAPLVQVLLGSSFAPATLMLQILLIQDLSYALNRPVNSFLVGTGEVKLLGRLSAVIVILSLLLNFLVVPPTLLGWGGAGVAAILAAGGWAGFIGCCVIAYRKTGLQPYWFTLLHIFLAAIACGGAWVFCSIFIADAPFLTLVVGSGLAVIAYLGLLILTRQVNGQDWKQLMNAFRPGAMYQYVRKEVR